MNRHNVNAMQFGKSNMNAVWLAALLPAVSLLFFTGCGGSIVGHWNLTKAIPNREALAIDEARFDRDGSYAAAVTVEGRTTREEGTYKFNGFRLTMRPNGGGLHRYDTFIRGGTLEVHAGDKKLILKKGKSGDEK